MMATQQEKHSLQLHKQNRCIQGDKQRKWQMITTNKSEETDKLPGMSCTDTLNFWQSLSFSLGRA